MSSETDIIIIGGGTAGLVLAARLSEDERLRVVVVESGADSSTDPRVLTPAMWPLLANTTLDWNFKTVPQANVRKKDLNFPQGRVLGGSSGINSFLFTPTSKAHSDAWAQLGNPGWEYSGLSQSVKEAITFFKPSGDVQGNGPVHVAVHSSEPESTWAEAWADSLESLGFPRCDPLAGDICGSFKNPETVDPATKQRSYSTSAYLNPIRANRPNLTVMTETTVTKILLTKKDAANDVTAEGVEIVDAQGNTKVIKARKEVILAAGAINSPRLLELSGIGGARHLNDLGIDVFVDNPNVGENLQNHVYTSVVFEVLDDVATLDPFFRSEPEAVAAAMEAYSKQTGPMGSSSIIASAQLPFPGIRTDEGRRDVQELLQSHLNDGTVGKNDDSSFDTAQKAFVRSVLTSPTEASGSYMFGPAFHPVEHDDPTYRAPGNHITIVVNLSHPLSRGSVHITDAAPQNALGNDGLAIDPRYLDHPLDLEVLARHVRFAEQEIARAEPLSRYLKPRTERFPTVKEAKDYVSQTAQGAHHYTGTCAMMPRAMGGVVDEELRVYGCTNLRICDSSVIPLEPRANTQAVVYGVAELAAKILKKT